MNPPGLGDIDTASDDGLDEPMGSQSADDAGGGAIPQSSSKSNLFPNPNSVSMAPTGEYPASGSLGRSSSKGIVRPPAAYSSSNGGYRYSAASGTLSQVPNPAATPVPEQQQQQPTYYVAAPTTSNGQNQGARSNTNTGRLIEKIG